MMVIAFIHFFIGGTIAAYFEIVLDEQSASLLSCTHKCLRMNAEVNFEPPDCRCFVNKDEKKSHSITNEGTLSGLFYQVRAYTIFNTLTNVIGSRAGTNMF